ncbi:MAG TPA: O-antigen ligase family protein [Bryobacteraceae bacterium]|nr:O-antigen ligase family protein [Bryobacteraceae bacterium]
MAAQAAPALLLPRPVSRARPRRYLSHSVAAGIIGLCTPLQLEWGGILYASEALLALVAVWALVTHLTDAQFWRRPFTPLMLSLGVTILAYVITDLVLGTEAQNLLRGWARPIFLGTNLAGLYFLCRRNPFNILIYAIAAASASIAFLAVNGRLLENWKFGASAPVTILIACLVPLLIPRGVLLGSVALTTVGLLHLMLDSREIGGNCLLAGALLAARCLSLLRWKSISWVLLGALASVGIGLFLWAYVLTDEEYSQRRHFSNAWRTASLVTAAGAIAESPWLGNGSQTNNFALQSRYDSIFADRTGIRYRGQQTDTSTFSPHSQILQAWFEAGLFGTVFFVYLGGAVAGALHFCIFRRRLDVFSVLFAFSLMRAIWHLLFSPFAGLARLDVALAGAIVCVIAIERRAVPRGL